MRRAHLRVVFDTNVLVSATIFGGLPRRALAAAIDGMVQLVTSGELLGEYERVLSEKFGFGPAAARAASAELEAISELVEAESITPTSRDPDDDRFLAVARSGVCDAIVSGDDDLLVLGSYEGIPIVNARTFVELVAASD